MENVTNFDDLFNPKVEVEKAEKKPSIEYKPSVDKGKNGIYQSVNGKYRVISKNRTVFLA